MSSQPETEHIQDSVAQVDNEIAVGEDLEFQRKWWRFENVVWVVLILVLLLDLLGAFGRGYLANATLSAKDGSVAVRYERIERFKTPSILTVNLGPTTVREGKVRLWLSESLVTDLGNQRVIPQPLSSVVGDGGTLYTFEATDRPTTVQFALEPSTLGSCNLALGVRGHELLHMKVFVMP
jgi:hypothetical protein